MAWKKADMKSCEIFQSSVLFAPIPVFVLDPNTSVRVWNRAAEQAFGWKADEVLNKPLPIVPEEGRVQFLAEFEQVLKGNSFNDLNYRRKMKNDSPVDVLLSTSPLTNQHGDVIGAIRCVTNLGQQKKTELLLRETNHRVKNQLQMVSSLLNIASRDLRDEVASRILNTSIDRIYAVSLSYDRISNFGRGDRLDLCGYLNDLVRYLSSLNDYNNRVSVITEISNPLITDAKTGTLCGLVLTELLTNALRHAFPGERTGVLRLSVTNDQPDQLLFSVEDNGIGLSESVDPMNPKTTGLHIVQILVKQLKGSLRVDRSQGTRWELRIDTSRRKKR